MELIIFSVVYILFGMLFSLILWWSSTHYDDPNWQYDHLFSWEELFLMIFIWPILFGFVNKESLLGVVEFYKKHPKLLASIVAISTSILVILVSLLNLAS